MIINLTPHAVNIVDNDGQLLYQIPASGHIARVSAKTVVVGEIFGIPVTETVFGDVENLPDPAGDTIYIVSSLVAQRCKGRTDVFIPNESVRNSDGVIVGCKSLGRI